MTHFITFCSKIYCVYVGDNRVSIVILKKMDDQHKQLKKLQQLESIEKEIASALQSAGFALTELSKEKVSAKQVENHTNSFLKTLESVENGLAKQIAELTQVSTSAPHEGSSYAAQKDLQMALHRLEHVRSRLAEMERSRGDSMRMAAPMHRGVSLPEGVHPPSRLQVGQGVQRALSMNEQMQQRGYQGQE